MLSDEWLTRYELLENLEIKLCRSVTGTRTRTTGVTAIALLVLRTGELITQNILDLVSINASATFGKHNQFVLKTLRRNHISDVNLGP